MDVWRNFLLVLSALWAFSAIQSATHAKPVHVEYHTSRQQLLTADVPSHPSPSIGHAVSLVFFQPSRSTTGLAVFEVCESLQATRQPSLKKNYRLIHTGLSPPSKAVLS